MSTNGRVRFLAVCLCFFLVCNSGEARNFFQSLALELQEPTPVVGENQCLTSIPSCFECSAPINVTIRAVNSLVDSIFEMEAVVTNVRRQPLMKFLEHAGSVSPVFNRFKTTYFEGLGYFIDTINGITGSIPSKTLWSIRSGGKLLDCGVSSYIPRNNEVILFNFTTYKDAGFE